MGLDSSPESQAVNTNYSFTINVAADTAGSQNGGEKKDSNDYNGDGGDTSKNLNQNVTVSESNSQQQSQQQQLPTLLVTPAKNTKNSSSSADQIQQLQNESTVTVEQGSQPAQQGPSKTQQILTNKGSSSGSNLGLGEGNTSTPANNAPGTATTANSNTTINSPPPQQQQKTGPGTLKSSLSFNITSGTGHTLQIHGANLLASTVPGVGDHRPSFSFSNANNLLTVSNMANATANGNGQQQQQNGNLVPGGPGPTSALDRRASFLAPQAQLPEALQQLQKQHRDLENLLVQANYNYGHDMGPDGEFLNSDDYVPQAPSQWTKYKLYLWLFLEEPFVSPAASCVSTLMVMLIFYMLLVSASEQKYHGQYNGPANLDIDPVMWNLNHNEYGSESSEETQYMDTSLDLPTNGYKVGDNVLRFAIVVFFTLEVLLRFAIAPKRRKFFTQPHNVSDILAVLPFWVNNVLQMNNPRNHLFGKAHGYLYFNVISIFSPFLWILKLTRYFSGWFLLSRALNDAFRALCVPVFFLMIVVMCGSSILLLVEKSYARSILNGEVGFQFIEDYLSAGPSLNQNNNQQNSQSNNNSIAPYYTSSEDIPSSEMYSSRFPLCKDAYVEEEHSCITIVSLVKSIHYVIVCVVSIQITDVYGKDVASTAGRVLAVMMMFLGVIFLSMPIAIVGTSFSQTWFEQDIIILVEKVRSRMRQQGYTTDDLKEVFNELDEDGKQYDLKEVFNELDEDGSGFIEFHEFKRMLEAFHFFGSLATCRKLFNHFDCTGKGSISYQEFVCGIFPEIIDVDDLENYDEEYYEEEEEEEEEADLDQSDLDDDDDDMFSNSQDDRSKNSSSEQSLDKQDDKDNKNNISHRRSSRDSIEQDSSSGFGNSSDDGDRTNNNNIKQNFNSTNQNLKKNGKSQKSKKQAKQGISADSSKESTPMAVIAFNTEFSVTGADRVDRNNNQQNSKDSSSKFSNEVPDSSSKIFSSVEALFGNADPNFAIEKAKEAVHSRRNSGAGLESQLALGLGQTGQTGLNEQALAVALAQSDVLTNSQTNVIQKSALVHENSKNDRKSQKIPKRASWEHPYDENDPQSQQQQNTSRTGGSKKKKGSMGRKSQQGSGQQQFQDQLQGNQQAQQQQRGNLSRKNSTAVLSRKNSAAILDGDPNRIPVLNSSNPNNNIGPGQTGGGHNVNNRLNRSNSTTLNNSGGGAGGPGPGGRGAAFGRSPSGLDLVNFGGSSFGGPGAGFQGLQAAVVGKVTGVGTGNASSSQSNNIGNNLARSNSSVLGNSQQGQGPNHGHFGRSNSTTIMQAQGQSGPGQNQIQKTRSTDRNHVSGPAVSDREFSPSNILPGSPDHNRIHNPIGDVLTNSQESKRGSLVLDMREYKNDFGFVSQNRRQSPVFHAISDGGIGGIGIIQTQVQIRPSIGQGGTTSMGAEKGSLMQLSRQNSMINQNSINQSTQGPGSLSPTGGVHGGQNHGTTISMLGNLTGNTSGNLTGTSGSGTESQSTTTVVTGSTLAQVISSGVSGVGGILRAPSSPRNRSSATGSAMLNTVNESGPSGSGSKQHHPQLSITIPTDSVPTLQMNQQQYKQGNNYDHDHQIQSHEVHTGIGGEIVHVLTVPDTPKSTNQTGSLSGGTSPEGGSGNHNIVKQFNSHKSNKSQGQQQQTQDGLLSQQQSLSKEERKRKSRKSEKQQADKGNQQNNQNQNNSQTGPAGQQQQQSQKLPKEHVTIIDFNSVQTPSSQTNGNANANRPDSTKSSSGPSNVKAAAKRKAFQRTGTQILDAGSAPGGQNTSAENQYNNRVINTNVLEGITGMMGRDLQSAIAGVAHNINSGNVVNNLSNSQSDAQQNSDNQQGQHRLSNNNSGSQQQQQYGSTSTSGPNQQQSQAQQQSGQNFNMGRRRSGGDAQYDHENVNTNTTIGQTGSGVSVTANVNYNRNPVPGLYGGQYGGLHTFTRSVDANQLQAAASKLATKVQNLEGKLRLHEEDSRKILKGLNEIKKFVDAMKLEREQLLYNSNQDQNNSNQQLSYLNLPGVNSDSNIGPKGPTLLLSPTANKSSKHHQSKISRQKSQQQSQFQSQTQQQQSQTQQSQQSQITNQNSLSDKIQQTNHNQNQNHTTVVNFRENLTSPSSAGGGFSITSPNSNSVQAAAAAGSSNNNINNNITVTGVSATQTPGPTQQQSSNNVSPSKVVIVTSPQPSPRNTAAAAIGENQNDNAINPSTLSTESELENIASRHGFNNLNFLSSNLSNLNRDNDRKESGVSMSARSGKSGRETVGTKFSGGSKDNMDAAATVTVATNDVKEKDDVNKSDSKDINNDTVTISNVDNQPKSDIKEVNDITIEATEPHKSSDQDIELNPDLELDTNLKSLAKTPLDQWPPESPLWPAINVNNNHSSTPGESLSPVKQEDLVTVQISGVTNNLKDQYQQQGQLQDKIDVSDKGDQTEKSQRSRSHSKTSNQSVIPKELPPPPGTAAAESGQDKIQVDSEAPKITITGPGPVGSEY